MKEDFKPDFTPKQMFERGILGVRQQIYAKNNFYTNINGLQINKNN